MLLSAAVAVSLLMIEVLDFHSSMLHVPAIIYQQSNQMKVILLGCSVVAEESLLKCQAAFKMQEHNFFIHMQQVLLLIV